MSINLLIGEIKDKNLTLVRSGEERTSTVDGVLAETKKALLELHMHIVSSPGEYHGPEC
jgi:hypothetical protein